MANENDTGLISARKQIEQAMEVAEAEKRRRLLRHRLEIAHAALTAFQNKQFGVAVQNFHSYLKILEELKNVSKGGLTPNLFDQKEDKNELLMISGVYWDLAKLYDRVKTAENEKEFQHYLEKYILFSKGMPFQHVCAETLRKFLATGKAIHKEEFKNAYKLLGNTRCFIATTLIDVTAGDTLPILRSWRDQYLRKFALGRLSIFYYYRWAPGIAQRLDFWPFWTRRWMGKFLDGIAWFCHFFI